MLFNLRYFFLKAITRPRRLYNWTIIKNNIGLLRSTSDGKRKLAWHKCHCSNISKDASSLKATFLSLLKDTIYFVVFMLSFALFFLFFMVLLLIEDLTLSFLSLENLTNLFLRGDFDFTSSCSILLICLLKVMTLTGSLPF